VSYGTFHARDWNWHPEALVPAYRSTRLRAPMQNLVTLPTSPTEASGPHFGQNILGELDNDLLLNFAKDGPPIGERIMVHGHVFDENGGGVAGALVEFWQCNSAGRYRHRNDGYNAPLDPNFGGCGRTITDENGYWFLRTIKPGPYPWPNGGNDWRPAHIHFSLIGSGFTQRLITQMYFEGDPLIPIDPIANSVSDPEALRRLTAKFDLQSSVPMDFRAYRWDIVLRGRGSTMFENRPEGN